MNITIDCTHIRTREDLYAAMDRSLPLPCGHSLDALHDVLTSITGTIRLEGWEEACAALGKYGQAAKKAVAHAALENEKLDILF